MRIWENKSELVSMLFTKYVSKQFINTNLIHLWTINTVLMTFDAKKSTKKSKSGCLNVHALKIIKVVPDSSAYVQKATIF